MNKDIETREDITTMVHEFYSRVQKDTLIGPIFIGAIKDQWPAHLEKLERFWETVLLHKPSYSGSPFKPHAQMPIGREHFETWLQLFYKTVDDHFAGEKAEEAKLRASKMAEMFQLKIQFLNQSPNHPSS